MLLKFHYILSLSNRFSCQLCLISLYMTSKYKAILNKWMELVIALIDNISDGWRQWLTASKQPYIWLWRYNINPILVPSTQSKDLGPWTRFFSNQVPFKIDKLLNIDIFNTMYLNFYSTVPMPDFWPWTTKYQ